MISEVAGFIRGAVVRIYVVTPEAEANSSAGSAGRRTRSCNAASPLAAVGTGL